MPIMDAGSHARQLFDMCVTEGQAARRIESDADAEAVRAELRRLARAAGVSIRTARLADTVVVARTDARLWRDDTATMRRKLTPS